MLGFTGNKIKQLIMQLIFVISLMMFGGLSDIVMADTYTITDLGTLGGNWSYAGDLNDQGNIVGISSVYSGAQHAYLWDGQLMNDLGTPSGYLASGAAAINNSGQIVGYTYGEYQSQFAYIFDNNEWTYLGTLPDLDYSVASDINDSYQIAGRSFMLGPDGGSRGWIWEGGNMTSLGTLGGEQSSANAINEMGEIVGYSQIYYPGFYIVHACLWVFDAIIDLGVLPEETNSAANDINDNGLICGSSSHQQPTYPFLTVTKPCVWDGDSIIEIGLLPGFARGIASAINNSGQVIGHANRFLSGGDSRAFIWQDGITTDLNDLIPPNSDWILESAADINDAGQIVGTGQAPNGQLHGYLLTPVPTDAPHFADNIPASYLIADNYPNPFNARTIIAYSLPESSPVNIIVYDVLGRAVQTLVDEYQAAGNYRVTWDAAGYSSGMYFYRIRTAKDIHSGHMTLLK